MYVFRPHIANISQQILQIVVLNMNMIMILQIVILNMNMKVSGTEKISV